MCNICGVQLSASDFTPCNTAECPLWNLPLTPTEEWEAHCGYDDWDDDEEGNFDDGGPDDPDDWQSEAEE